MRQVFSKHRFIRRHIVALFGVCLCLYFSYHTLQGERGLTRAWGLSQETKQLEQEYAALKSERETLEARVQMLRPSSLHKDLLEERVRVVLGYGHADEILLMRN